MNLWVNRLKQLTILAVALFFYSCKEDVNLLGFKNPNSKFDVQYIELPVESSVLLFDTLRTSNYFFPGEVSRLLVGKTVDPVFGNVTVETCTQFYSQSSAKLLATATFDYATIDLTFDNYTYGATKSASPQDISIYELDQILYDTLRRNYTNKTPILRNSELVATKSFTLDPAVLQSYKDKNKDTTLTLTVVSDLGERLFQSALDYRDDLDTTFAHPSLFVKKFPGIAIVPNGCDKVFGFNPTNTKSRITLHYHLTTDTIKRVLNLVFYAGSGYNNISSNRSGTPLELLTKDEDHKNFYPLDSNRYIQSGTGIFTKLDFEHFLNFSDSIPNMILNSAELVIGNVENGGDFDPPAYLALRVLKEDNFEYAIGRYNTQAISDRAFYKGFITPDYYIPNAANVLIENDSVFSVAFDAGVQLEYIKSSQKYNAYLTRYLQQLYTKEENKTRLQYFVLYPVSPVAAKSVNRVRFPKDNIKLRIYYTLPTVND